MKKFLSPRYVIIAVIIFSLFYLISNRQKLISSFETGVGLERPDDTTDNCPKDFVFSEKECKCVADAYRCEGLDKEKCAKNQNCYSYSRSGSCSCPSCQNMLDHQCLPIDDLL